MLDWFRPNRIRVRRYGKTSSARVYANLRLAEYCSALGAKRVLNVGAKPEAGDKQGRTYEDYFPGADFRTIDLAPFDHPRHREVDVMSPPEDLGEYDLVLCMSMLEHVDRPWLAAPHITRMVRPGGHLFVSMPWFYPVHEGPGFGDHWRATPSAMTFLFDQMEAIRHDYYPSVIKVVHDRKRYWNDPNSTASGFAMLLRRPIS